MVKEYQETANFMYGAHNGDELKKMAASQWPFFPPQKFFVKRALILNETDYHFFVHDDFRNPPYALKALRQCMGFDMGKQAWNCVLVVSEAGKDGILVSKELNAERYYMAHIPEHGKLHLPSDLPIEFWTNVCTTNLQLQPTAEIKPPKTELENRQQHFASFVGMEMSSLCFALRFISYDPQTDQMVTRLYDAGGFDQDLEHQMLQTEIEYRLHRSNIPRDFFSVQHKDEPKEDLAEELAKTLTIDTAEVDPALLHALPALWKKRTDWEASKRQHSGSAESAKTMVCERRRDVR